MNLQRISKSNKKEKNISSFVCMCVGGGEEEGERRGCKGGGEPSK